MPTRETEDTMSPSRFASITSPIPLLALFGGVTEAIVGLMAARVTGPDARILIIGAIALPVLWLVAIVFLIAKYHEKLYSPHEYGGSQHFLKTLHGKDMVNQGTLGNPQDFSPFRLPKNVTPEDQSALDAVAMRWDRLFSDLDPHSCLALHAWFNERENHFLGIISIQMAIAKGLIASKNYSFASTSFRKLGRLIEAESLARLALQLDAGNTDAKYSLARTYQAMGQDAKSLDFASEVLSSGQEPYIKRIHARFPRLVTS